MKESKKQGKGGKSKSPPKVATAQVVDDKSNDTIKRMKEDIKQLQDIVTQV